MKSQPLSCRPEAFRLFAEQLPVIETTDGLLNAAIAISMHALDGVDPRDINDRLLAYAARIRSRARGGQIQALMAHLHQVLFVEEEFAGNRENYYDPRNSFVSAVIQSRRGIPVTLALVYKVVAERAGLCAQGINAPGHFLVRVRGNRDWMIVDPFYGGDLLNRDEAFERISRVAGRPIPHSRHYLPPATHSQWLSRILTNLQHVLCKEKRSDDLAAMNELQGLLSDSLY